jgi:hypothetical protein
VAVIAALAGFGGTVLSSCATHDALALAQQACKQVDRSITLYLRADKQPDVTVADSERAQALVLLRRALPPASIAAGEDGQWQALMADLSETSRVPESDLVTGLEAACQVTSVPQPGGVPTTSAPAPISTPSTTIPTPPTRPPPVGH